MIVGIEMSHLYRIREEDLGSPYDEIIDMNGTFLWELEPLSERMRAQQALMIGSSVEHHIWGTMSVRELDWTKSLVCLAVDPGLKRQALGLAGFGYNDRTLFPDLPGFSRFHGPARPLSFL